MKKLIHRLLDQNEHREREKDYIISCDDLDGIEERLALTQKEIDKVHEFIIALLKIEQTEKIWTTPTSPTIITINEELWEKAYKK